MSRSRERRRPSRLKSLEILAIALVSVALLGWSGFSIRSLMNQASVAPSHRASTERTESQSVFYEAALVSCLDVLWIGWLIGRLRGRGDGAAEAAAVRGRARRRRRREAARSMHRDPEDKR